MMTITFQTLAHSMKSGHLPFIKLYQLSLLCNKIHEIQWKMDYRVTNAFNQSSRGRFGCIFERFWLNLERITNYLKYVFSRTFSIFCFFAEGGEEWTLLEIFSRKCWSSIDLEAVNWESFCTGWKGPRTPSHLIWEINKRNGNLVYYLHCTYPCALWNK